ncbi:MAG: hypothetical protein B6U87_00250 [Candidatus Aenigmarchaeota archaeon ex4484_52]|nr:MAG: hypothetical protein B6U87_00250 [Candidatus Aenigmarchaeota archaeon ex4484_52]
MVSKKEIITEVFKIYKKRNDFVFTNNLIKEFVRKFKSKTNPYDITKLDGTSNLTSYNLGT